MNIFGYFPLFQSFTFCKSTSDIKKIQNKMAPRQVALLFYYSYSSLGDVNTQLRENSPIRLNYGKTFLEHENMIWPWSQKFKMWWTNF